MLGAGGAWIDLALQLALVFALVYNNSLVVVGPLAWGGLTPQRVLPVIIIAELVGTFATPMRAVIFPTPYYAAALGFYLAFTAAKISLPISVFLYSLRGPNAAALTLWFGTAPAAFSLGYAAAKWLRPNVALGLLLIFAVGYMFGANNIAFITASPLAAVPVVLGNLLGLRYSRWIVRLYAFSLKGAVSASAASSIIAAAGTAFGVPISFTFATYSTLLGSAAARRIKIIRIGDFVRALLAISLALALAYLTKTILAIPVAAGLMANI